METQRQSTTQEINELTTSKHKAYSERDEIINKFQAVTQDYRREIYTLKRIVSNIMVHMNTTGGTSGSSENTRVHSSVHSSSTSSRAVMDLFSTAEESGMLLHFYVMCSMLHKTVLYYFSMLHCTILHCSIRAYCLY